MTAEEEAGRGAEPDRVIGDDPAKPEENIFGSKPKRGDVIVFQHPHSDRVMIKRLVGLPGDRIEVKAGRLYLNGTEVPREKVRTTTYVPDDSSRLVTATEFRQTIPTGEGEQTKSFLIHEFSDSNDLDETPVFTVPLKSGCPQPCAAAYLSPAPARPARSPQSKQSARSAWLSLKPQ